MHKWVNRRTWLFVLVFLPLAFLGSFFVINSSDSEYSNDNADNTGVSTSSEKIIPARIKIPSIGIDALVKPVGLTKQKFMESPEGPEDAGWFKLGASPGEKGSSIIAGHRGWKMRSAIFDNLHKIKIGEKVYVEDEKGNTRAFVVLETRTYGAEEIVPEVWNKDNDAYLNLITCSGKWNVFTGTSEERLVVFTKLVT